MVESAPVPGAADLGLRVGTDKVSRLRRLNAFGMLTQPLRAGLFLFRRFAAFLRGYSGYREDARSVGLLRLMGEPLRLRGYSGG